MGGHPLGGMGFLAAAMLLLAGCPPEAVVEEVRHEDEKALLVRPEVGADGVGVPDTPDPYHAHRVSIAPRLRSLTADGRSSTTLELQVTTAHGFPVPDGTVLSLSSTLGRVESVEPTVDGVARAVFVAGTWPGTALLDADNMVVEGTPAVTLTRGDATSMQLHLHGSLSEGNGTMRGHSGEADRIGVDLLWWTDHDFLYSTPTGSSRSTGWTSSRARSTSRWLCGRPEPPASSSGSSGATASLAASTSPKKPRTRATTASG